MTSCALGQVRTRARSSTLSRVGAVDGGFGMSKAEWNVSANCEEAGRQIEVDTDSRFQASLYGHRRCRSP